MSLGKMRAIRATFAKPLLFNLLFWTPFWLIPIIAINVGGTNNAGFWFSWTYRLSYLGHCLEGFCFSAGMACVAELCGRGRRYFYLLGGTALWVGSALSVCFIAGSRIQENVFTIATVLAFASNHTRASLGFIQVDTIVFAWLATITFPHLLLLWCWRHVAWQMAMSRVVVAFAVFVFLMPLRLGWRVYNGDYTSQLLSYALYPTSVEPIRSYLDLIQARRLLHGLFLSPDRPAPKAAVLPGARPVTLVVVVGESTSRDHMQLYGYCRDTTPKLSAMAPQLFVMQNVISEIPLTVFALSHAFRVRLGSPENSHVQTTLDVFKAAGFDTYWVSNQFDYDSDPLGVMIATAAHRKYVYRRIANTRQMMNPPDQVLLPPLSPALAALAPNKVIFLHSMGAHMIYEDRYPPGLLPEGFSGPSANRSAAEARKIQSYDKAVRYMDGLVSEVIKMASNKGGDIAVVYFSDHGEEVFDSIGWNGHRFPAASRSMVEIPLIVWLSPDLRRDRPGLAKALEKSRIQKMHIDDISPFLFEIAGLHVTGLSPAQQPLNTGYAQPKRLVDDKDYDRDPSLGASDSLSPLCPKR